MGIIGILCTFDEVKKDSEVKILYRCSEDNISTALMMANNGPMNGVLVRRNS